MLRALVFNALIVPRESTSKLRAMSQEHSLGIIPNQARCHLCVTMEFSYVTAIITIESKLLTLYEDQSEVIM